MISREQIKELKIKDENYPFLLSQITSPPESIYVIGNEKILHQKSVTVIGSRKMTEYGKRMTEKFTRELVKEGYGIVSGLARGIDGMAHRSCLESSGKTVAVLGHGMDRIYPPEHRGLAKQIVMSGGCLVTEFPYGYQIKRQNFIMRNRIMAGLTLGTLVIEGAKKSGTKVTATMAADYGREVFSVPGPVESQLSEGPAELIQDGAKLVTRVEDILEEFTGSEPVNEL